MRRVSELIRVAIVENELAADVVVGFLETEGIPAIRQAAAAPSGSPFGSAGGIAGPFEVLVHPENEARARELLETSGAEPDSG